MGALSRVSLPRELGPAYICAPTHPPQGFGVPPPAPGTTGLSSPGPAPSCHPPVASPSCCALRWGRRRQPWARRSELTAPPTPCAGDMGTAERAGLTCRAGCGDSRTRSSATGRRSCERGGSAVASSALGAGNRPPSRIPPKAAARPRPRNPRGAGPPGTGRESGAGLLIEIERGLYAQLGLGESLLVQARGWAELLVNRVGPEEGAELAGVAGLHCSSPGRVG